ncbi:MAG TPA: hypothetical protein VMV10_21355 [Pirellulales bacterium]|nr:hypothetical protein [Pirellulales bacterium]
MSWGWRPYVPVATRRAQAAGFAQRLAKKEGRQLQPVKIGGQAIARTFWGKAWCDNLESYSDFANRLPRGRTYVRNGSVVDLQIEPGCVKAYVSGSEIYEVKIEIDQVQAAAWKRIKSECSASIDSLLDLLAGRFSDGVMQRLTRPADGLFPQPKQIRMACSCPDWAVLCKHVAAVLYGVGARLDEQPQLLFLLRNVDHNELVSQAVSAENLSGALGESGEALAGEDLGAMFGIDLDSASPGDGSSANPRKRKSARDSRSATKAGKASGSSRRSAATSKRKVAAGKPAAKQSAGRKKQSAAAKRTTRKKRVET